MESDSDTFRILQHTVVYIFACGSRDASDLRAINAETSSVPLGYTHLIQCATPDVSGVFRVS